VHHAVIRFQRPLSTTSSSSCKAATAQFLVVRMLEGRSKHVPEFVKLMGAGLVKLEGHVEAILMIRLMNRFCVARESVVNRHL